ncbi:Uncharacterized protein PCOAH_00052950 [Plasmodium coatneyi]|uniref:Nucleoporin n=1 Tax=Plasmodium coatneyi TaxID=208452 RepID=A0A1B1E7H7_9APIC|nr:Uncharacterized protein PCOAH_00052950 [Plasmodium coatneyi]ANQ10951.1 Uncharacterized protein PCOAH_00052950 [Plasmodium coatneyi]
MDGFDETKMKQLQLLKERMKIAKAQKVEEVKNNEDVFSLSHDVKNVRSFETQDIRFNKIGKKIFDVFTPNKKVTHIKGTNSRFPFQQAKSGNTNFPFKTKNGLIKLANESSAFDTPLTFEEVMRRKNEKKKRELEKSGQNGMVDDILNNVRQFNVSEDKNELGLPQGMHGPYEEDQPDQVNHGSHAGSADAYGDIYSGSPLRQLQETNDMNNYNDAGGLHQSKLHDKATNNEQAVSGYATENNHPINGSLSNNTSSFGMDVVRKNPSLPHGMNSFNNYFSHQVGKGQDDAQNGADLNRTSPEGVNNVNAPLSESFPGTSSGSGLGSLFGSNRNLTKSSGSNIFGCSLSKLNQSSIFNQTVSMTSSDQGPSVSIHKGDHVNLTPSASSAGKGDIGGESTHRLFQGSGNSTLGASNIFGTHNAPVGSSQQPVANSSLLPPSPNKSIEASSLFSRNDANNMGSLFNNSFSGNNLNSTRNAPDGAGKSGLFNNTSDSSGGNIFGKSKNNVNLFSGSIFGKSSSGTTNLFGTAPSEKNPFGSAAKEQNPLGNAAKEQNLHADTTIEKANSGKGIFGNVPGSSKPFGSPPSGSNIFGTPANATSNLFGKPSGGTNLFNKSAAASNANQFGNANSIFGKPLVGSNIFGVSNSVNNEGANIPAVGSVNGGSTPDSRYNPPGESLLNTSNKLLSDCPTSTNSVTRPYSSTNRFGLPSSVGSVVTAPSQGYLPKVTRGVQNNSDVNERVMKFRNTLSSIKSKRSGDANEQITPSSGDKEAQVDQTGEGDIPAMGEQPPGEDSRGVEKNHAEKQSEQLQRQNLDQGGSNKDVVAESTCDNHSGESAKGSHDNDKEEGTNIRKTFSSYFNTFIPSIFSSPNKQAPKDEYPKGDTSNGEVKKTNVEVNQNSHVSPLGNDTLEGDNLDTNPLCRDKEGEMKTFFSATPLRDPPDGGNTVTSNQDSVLLNGEKVNEPPHLDPFVTSDKPNSSNHETPSHVIGEPEQMHKKKTPEGINLPLGVNQNGIVNPLSDKNNKMGSLFHHVGSVPSSRTHPEMEGKMNPTGGIPFSNVNVGRSAGEVTPPTLDEKSSRSYPLGSADEPRDIFQKDPSHNDLIEVANADSIESKEDLEKMNQIYKNINCINKNINYINKYVPSTIEDVDNYLQANITSVQNYDALSDANRTCLEKLNAQSSSAQSNKELKNMINVLNKQVSRVDGSSTGEDNRSVPTGKVKGSLFCNPFNRGNQVDVTHNTKGGVMASAPDGGTSKCYPIFNATGKHTPGGNFVNTNKLTPGEKLKLINETSKEIASNEESDAEEKIPEHVQKIMERREYFKTKNKLTNSGSNKSIGMKKIKPFVPSECSESFRNTFYTNENSKNKNNVFSLQNLSNMNILSPNKGNTIGAAAGGSYPKVDDRSAIFKDSPVEQQNRNEKHTLSSCENFFTHKNKPPSSSNTVMDFTFSSENAQDGYNPFTPTKSFNSAVNSGEVTSRMNGVDRGDELKPSGESLIRMEEELNRQTDFISNIYTSLGKNNFIYDNSGGMDTSVDKQTGDHTNTDDAPFRKRSLDSISRVHDENDDLREDESNTFDNVEKGNDDDPTCAQKKKRKFSPNGMNAELVPKENRCIDISNCVKEIRDSTTLADISTNLSKYTVESERILCDIINDTFKMSLKISSLSDLPFLFEDFP